MGPPWRKKILLLGLTGLLLSASAVIVVWRINAWNKTGWVGMEFQPGRNWVNKVEKFYFAVGTSLATKGNPGYISTVFEDGPADRAGIEPRSVVLEIAGIPLDSEDNINALIASTGIGDTLIYRIRKDTTILEFALSLETPLRSRQIFLSLTSSIIIGLVFLAIGFWVYWKKPESRPAFVFYMMSAVAAAGFFQYSISLPDRTNTIGFGKLAAPSLCRSN